MLICFDLYFATWNLKIKKGLVIEASVLILKFK
ncbi:hypothetical protein NSB1T_13545 [Coprobacter fastidiosus NSB1 = JCM 33896]|nr:hypothetical protein NSB1T_13545 [Coprobacter fastidiosus NSB1 = JCM 33896]